ncbi:MAG TPA: hypothetical protein RMH85_18930 [Polyangiaceae bacterium LLY-WYZ-15_(1-7)]|nr:hypothetical protein [Myxococcales bacterium]MAT29472.1 hypothetical protein [Sandaracinus sp.]HJK93218.1 hypothetical protein [Polyangiaceae bacterium LLY-WYZ-15_(1-7)]MBJ70650.1 hypothetical protein [Sandaracinus sp.]HJL05084.1 hypothetical protein [Polyangiaceae bacterium LLY-WYZ-15_(1-7)]
MRALLLGLGLAFALAPAPLRAAPDGAGSAPATFQFVRHGQWCLEVDSVYGLLVHNRSTPTAVRLRFTEHSNGWFWLETRAARYVSWTAGTFSEQDFAFGDGKIHCSPRELADGSHTFGTWQLRRQGDELVIGHPANGHQVVLDARSTGDVRLRGLQGQADRVVHPADALPTTP